MIRMTDILHIIDRSAPLDMLRQLQFLAGDGDRFVSLGPPPAHWTGKPIREVHCPLGSKHLAGVALRPLIASARIVHCWSMAAARALPFMGPLAGKVLSLPTAGGNATAAEIAKAFIGGDLHITVPTQASARLLVKAGLPQSYVHVVPPAATPAEHAASQRTEVRRALNISDDEILMVCPNEMIRYAGHKYAAWCHAVLMQVDGRVRLLLAGGGEHNQSVRSFAQTTGYDREVILSKDRFTPEQCLSAGDIGVFLVERDCGLSMVAQAFAMGLSAAASSTADLVEFTDGGRRACLAPPADPRLGSAALLRLIEEPQYARQLAQEAKAFALANLTPQRVRAAMQAVYLDAGA